MTSIIVGFDICQLFLDHAKEYPRNRIPYGAFLLHEINPLVHISLENSRNKSKMFYKQNFSQCAIVSK